ncbi:MAG: amidohydrolase [Actinomycetota bacterium]
MQSDESADLIITGDVYTVNPTGPWAKALAIKGGRIVAIGGVDEVADHKGAGTEVLELAGGMVLPGFQDAHVHPPSSGMDRLRCNLEEVVDLEEVKRIVAGYAADNPTAEWILGGGWSMSTFPNGLPTRELLDELVPDRPAFLSVRDGHTAWVNSRALELAGITAETPDPPAGRIERRPDGEPYGVLHEHAMSLVEDLAPTPTKKEVLEGLLVAQRHLHSLGITAWQDAAVGDTPWGNSFDAYVEAAGNGDLTARVIGALWWDRERGEEQVEELTAMRAAGVVGRFAATSVKIWQDGILENFSASMLEPYLDEYGKPTGNRGQDNVDPERLPGYVTRLDREGFQVHFHAIGDRAVRQCLDAIEAAREANGPNDHRHHIAHIQVVHPDDVPRFAALDVVANAQPLWACHEPQMDELTIPFIGPERTRWQYPFGSLKRTGARLAFGSDWSVSSANPLEEIEVAVTRVAHDERDNEPLLPEERIDLATAVEAFTLGSAFVNHMEDSTGSIEVGKLADLAVLDRNIFRDGPIADAKVTMTFVEGSTVYEAGSVGS